MRHCLTMVVLAGWVGGTWAADAPSGEAIYRTKCASCHGATGEGTKKASRPLFGDKSPAQLAKIIAKTMPEDDPGTCTGPDADAVAAYIHTAFYSKEARDRNKPPRVELARLTVRQYRLAIADLVGTFRAPFPKEERQGLKAEYYDARNFRNDKRVLERVDPEINFDFKDGTPVAGKIDAHQFAIRWEGAVQAPETGMYEFVVRTDHAARLWVNDNAKPLIDAWVKSGTNTEYREAIYLLGGRSYPVKLEFSKAKQGVDDTKKEKERPPLKAMAYLEWKRPHRETEVIPQRFLLPARAPESFVASVPFPPDDRSYGWERGTTVSKEWDQATTDQALEAANFVVSKLNELAGTNDKATDRPAKIRAFAGKFAERAFRKPLSAEQKALYIDRQFDASKDPEVAIKRVVLFVLKSPRFLYREASTSAEAYDTAARLSFALWDSLPDAELLNAAARGQLSTRAELTQQAERMWNDPRAKAKMRDFLLLWVKADRATEVAKDAKKFPGFDGAFLTDLRTSLDLFLDEVLQSPDADFRRLLQSEELHLNGRLAKFYGANLPPEAPFQKVKLNPEHRAGVLTHPFLMAAFAYTSDSSPIHRGVFLTRSVLGRLLMPPQEAITPITADLHPTLTTRERVALQTKGANCMTCHSTINNLGFALENFDAVGRYREKDNNKAVDASGSYQTPAGTTKTFTGAKALANFLVNHDEVHRAFSEQLFHHLIQQAVKAYGADRAKELPAYFVAQQFNIRKLAIEIAVVGSMPVKR